VKLAADAVVIGTGAGGAPVAAVLAEAGMRVIVLEAGARVETGDFTGDEAEMTRKLWRLGLAGRGLSLYSGACVGGSAVIDDALCFRPPPALLQAWRDYDGLSGLTDEVMAPFVDRSTARRARGRSATTPARSGWARPP
jgi:choline dehydrogenase-like flavoprotein